MTSMELLASVIIYPADSGLPMTVWVGPRRGRDAAIAELAGSTRIQRLKPTPQRSVAKWIATAAHAPKADTRITLTNDEVGWRACENALT
jgi:hypothetical protein